MFLRVIFLKIKTLFLSFIATIILLLVFKKEQKIKIPTDAIRIRIIANSQNDSDINEKMRVKEELETEVYKLLVNAKSISEAKDILSKNLDKLNIQLEKTTTNYSLNFGQNYFPKKVYKGIIYEEGVYDSLVITLGKGAGDNWWCVLFPPLCLLEDNETTKDVEYRFFLQDLLNKYK